MLFAATVPVTKVALTSFSSFEIALVRLVIGGFLAFLYLAYNKRLHYLKDHFRRGLFVAIGIGSFPFFLCHAMAGLPGTFSSVALGVLPLITGLISITFFGERVGKKFYFFSILGSVTVVLYSLEPHFESYYHLLMLLMAILFVSSGYVHGSELSKKTTGPMAISIGLTIFLPLVIVLSFFICDLSLIGRSIEISKSSVQALLYLAFFSQYLGFFPFYTGLARVGTARGIQIQLLQPFFGLLLSVILLGESTKVSDFLALTVVLTCIYMANRQRKIAG
jgi:drug/metabolite transporter (DMT)-like permease